MSSEKLKVQKSSSFYEKYELGSVLGDGNFSTVKECFDKSTMTKRAVKIVSLKGEKSVQEDLHEMMIGEVSLMQNLNHGNIVQCLDAFFGSSEILVVLEYTEGGDLYDYIVNSGPVAEDIAREIMKDIASALSYLHSKNIVHRDIKPENFLLFKSPSSSKNTVKLCDFGLAIEASEELTEVCGSPSYVAPEVLRMDGYGLPADIWSCGVVMYVLLCQFAPFYGNTSNKLFACIMDGKYDFPAPYWDNISSLSRHLIAKMLVEQERRITAEQVLLHPWFDEAKNSTGREDAKAKTDPRKGFKEVAMAVQCVQRFSEPIRKPLREQAILSRSIVEQAKL